MSFEPDVVTEDLDNFSARIQVRNKELVQTAVREKTSKTRVLVLAGILVAVTLGAMYQYFTTRVPEMQDTSKVYRALFQH